MVYVSLASDISCSFFFSSESLSAFSLTSEGVNFLPGSNVTDNLFPCGAAALKPVAVDCT